jgi:hypothetical protein
VTGQLVGSAEALGASGESAGMGLLARVRSDVSSLMLEAVEGLVAQGALVGAGHLARAVLVGHVHVCDGLREQRGRCHVDRV